MVRVFWGNVVEGKGVGGLLVACLCFQMRRPQYKPRHCFSYTGNIHGFN